MKKSILVVLGIILVVVTLTAAGCSVEATMADKTTPVNVSLNSQDGIWVSGTGKVAVAPDLAVLSLGVEVEKTSVAEAQAQAAATMEKVMQVLTGRGIAKADIQTQQYNIYQMTRWDDMAQTSKPTGYNVSNMLSVKVRDMTVVSDVIDEVVAAGGDDIRFHGINFTVEKPEQYYTEAREHAMQDARASAEKLAALAGVSLGDATYIVENAANQNYYYSTGNSGIRAAVEANYLETPISIGQNEVVMTVTVAYAIN